MKKRILALILIVSVAVLVPFSAFAAGSGGFHLSATSVGVRPGDCVKISAYNGTSAVGAIWSSADESVATVNGEGVVVGVRLGQTTVTASWGSYQASCVVNVARKGIDVSSWQGSAIHSSINWSTVKASGVDFAMIRTGLGSSASKDADFETNYTNAKASGIKVGVYHVAYATSVAVAQREADYCLQILGGRKLDYPVAYDLETSEVAGLSDVLTGQVVQAFCSKIQAAGYKAIVYTYKSFYESHLTSSLVSQYDTWIAHYGVAKTSFSRPYTMWQYSSSGSVPGISGACDLDYGFYDYSTGGGGGQGVQNPQPAPQVFRSDTTATYTFGANKDYVYKITTNDTITPTAASSNPAAVSVSYYGRTGDGYLFKIMNRGAGRAVITTTAANGMSVSFQAVGTGSSVQTPSTQAPSGGALKCDTTAPYTFGSNASYVYKVYTASSTRPAAVSSNPAAVSVAFAGRVSDGYLFRIANVGAGSAVITTTAADGSKASFTATGSAPVPAAIASDTPYQFAMKRGGFYTYRFTPSAGQALTFSTGNGSVIAGVSVYRLNGSYYYKIRAVGAGGAGVYAAGSNGVPQRVGVVTVS